MTAIEREAVIATIDDLGLTDAYSQANPDLIGSILVVTEQSEVDARIRDLQAKLGSLGVSDVTQEGSLILGGTVEVTPGLRKGVGMVAQQLDTSVALDLDTLPELFDYTNAGRKTPDRILGTPQIAGGPTAQQAGTLTGALTGTPTNRPHRPVRSPRAARAVASAHPIQVGGPISGSHRLSTGRTLVMMSASTLAVDEAIIVAKHLQLQDGTQIVIANNVKYLTIIAQRITVGTDVTITWESAAAPSRGTAEDGSDGTSYLWYTSSTESAFNSPNGGDGGDGDDGDQGYPGDDAPTLEIWGLDVTRLPEIDLQGGQGGTGQRGGDGGNGGNGAKGLQSHSMSYGCDRSVGFGGDGGDGGEGGTGGLGGVGGVGGDLKLYLIDASHEAVLAAGLSDNRSGGLGGDGGEPGNGGNKGQGGEAGDPEGLFCHPKPERAGVDGADGADGDDGETGPQGSIGFLTAVVITPDQFRAKWTAPQIRTVTPFEAMVGDVVTIDGANFTADATVRFGSTASAATTVIADTILQAEVPNLGTGWVDVVVDIPGGESSNPGSLKVIPSMIGVTPNPAAAGSTITVFGSGFVPGCHVLFQGVELDPSAVASDGTSVVVTLPKLSGPFEDFGGVEPILVRNPDGIATEPVDLVLRHVLSTGFDVTLNGYAFLNQLPLAALADMGTFEETYGTADVVSNFLLEPVLTGAWYLFYRDFFNNPPAPGYSSGFSTTAANEYWSGNPDLSADHSALPEVERLMTVAQGHILSREMLTKLAGQALAGTGRSETSLDEVEYWFREMLSMTDDARRKTAPIMQLLPAGTITTSGFVNKLGASHGLLPIRVEWPEDGETWEKRIILYDNAGTVGVEEQAIFTRDSNGLGFVVTTASSAGKDTAHGWILSQASLDENLLLDVSMPTDYMFMLSPATVLVEDAEGRKFGVRGKNAFADIPGAMPAMCAPNLYLLPLDQDLTFSVTGTGTGTYTLGIVSGSLGRSVTLVDVPVKPTTRDIVRIADGLREVVVESADASKELTLHYGVAGVQQARALKLERARVGRTAGLTLRSSDNLASFELQGKGADQRLSLELVAADTKAVKRHSFDDVAVTAAKPTTFDVTDWTDLGQDSLRNNGDKPGRSGNGKSDTDKAKRSGT